jgi:hypothetical protein
VAPTWRSCGDKTHLLFWHARSPSESITSLKRSSTGVTCFSWIPGCSSLLFMGMRPTLYHFTQGTSFPGLGLIIYPFFSFLYAFCLLPSLQGNGMSIWGFSYVITINDREGSQGWRGGLSTGTRAKGSCTTHGFGEGTTQSSFAFFLDDKYVR